MDKISQQSFSEYNDKLDLFLLGILIQNFDMLWDSAEEKVLLFHPKYHEQ